jgi:O-antigen ligase
MNSVLNGITKYTLALYFLLLPVFFLPITNDLFELNKSLIIVLFGITWLILLAVKNFRSKSLDLTTSYLFVPTLILVVAYLISSVFSISTSYTLWGFYGFLANSLPMIIMLLFLPVLMSSLVESKDQLKHVWVFLTAGLFITVLFSLIGYFQVIPATGALVFLSTVAVSTAGGFIILKYVLMLLGLVSGVGFVTSGKNSIVQVFYTVALLVTLVLAVLVMPTHIIVMVLALCAAPFAVFRNQLDKQKIVTLVAAGLVVVAVAVFNFVPSLRESAGLNKEVPAQVSLSFSDSWAVANSVIGQKVAFGSGPSTFIWDYTTYKPQRINNTDLWDTVFVKPSSLYLLVLAEAGIVGFTALMYYIFRLVAGGIKSIRETGFDKNSKVTGTFMVIVLFLAFFFATPGNAFTLGMFFGFVGLMLAYQKVYDLSDVTDVSINLSGVSNSRKTSSLAGGGDKKTFNYLHIVFAALVAIIVVFYGYFFGKIYTADVVFASVYNRPETLLDLRQNYIRAARINPRNDYYQRSVINVDTSIAQVYLNPEDPDALTDEEKLQSIQTVQQLLSEASRVANYITSGTDLGINVRNWEARGLLFQRGIGLVTDADVNSLQSYSAAASLNPNNPRIFASAGSVYFASGNYAQAAQNFERAVLLKPDYAAARYNLARAYEELGQNANALAVARTVVVLVPEGSADRTAAEEYVATLEVKVATDQESAAAQQQLTLEEGTEPSASQPALTNPAQPPQGAAQQGRQTPAEPNQNVQEEVEEGSEEQGADSGLPDLPNQQENTQEDSGFIESSDN